MCKTILVSDNKVENDQERLNLVHDSEGKTEVVKKKNETMLHTFIKSKIEIQPCTKLIDMCWIIRVGANGSAKKDMVVITTSHGLT